MTEDLQREIATLRATIEAVRAVIADAERTVEYFAQESGVAMPRTVRIDDLLDALAAVPASPRRVETTADPESEARVDAMEAKILAAPSIPPRTDGHDAPLQKPRVETAEELNALPDRTVIRDADEWVFEKLNYSNDSTGKSFWAAPAIDPDDDEWDIEPVLPADILWLPADGGGQS